MSAAGRGPLGKEWLKRWTTVLSHAAASSYLLPINAGSKSHLGRMAPAVARWLTLAVTRVGIEAA